jgi:hypothetical protein
MKYLVLVLTLSIASFLAAQDRGKDGHYHDPYTGEAQPDMCDNSFKNSHPCECVKTKKTECDDQPTHPGQMCKTFCREKDCHCAGVCTS